MKFAAFIVLTALAQIPLSGKSQTVEFSGKDVPLVNIFAIIKKQTGTLFFYEESLMKDAKPVTVTLKNVPLLTALNEIFKDQPLTWALEDKTVTVSKKGTSSNNPGAIAPQQPLLIEVRGKITDENGNSVTDVTVTVKGKNQGTIADDNGRCLINKQKMGHGE